MSTLNRPSGEPENQRRPMTFGTEASGRVGTDRLSQRPKRGAFERYLESAEKFMPQQWPADALEGKPIMPIAVHLHALAKLHGSMSKRINQLEGFLVQERVELAAERGKTARTQKYIQQMHGRIDQAGRDGLTVTRFIEQEHERVREYRNGGNSGVFASEPTEP